MKIQPSFLYRLILPAALALALVGPAAAQTPQNPFPITGPTTLTQAGYYRLQNNIVSTATSGNIITVSANNVTIDFNGFFIAGPTTNTTQTLTGINANERSNLTITNGTIAYCAYGIIITGNGTPTTNNVGHRIERMRVTYCLNEGIRVYNALGTFVTNNQLSQIGGSTSATNVNAFGMNIGGGSVVVESNLISSVTARGTGTARGIFADSGVFSTRNFITKCAIGIDFGKCYNNQTFFCTEPFKDFIDAGANNGADS